MALSLLPSSYEISLSEMQILRASTEFVPRILEQTLITELKPTLNSLCNSVLFTYNNWSLLNIYNYATDGSIAVQISNAETGEILLFVIQFLLLVKHVIFYKLVIWLIDI